METMELEPDEFWRMVTEENLKTDGPSAGYMWTGKRGVAGWEVYKTRSAAIGWLYQGRRVNTQNAVGGGGLITRISMPTGTVGTLVSMYCVGTASAGSTLTVNTRDEDTAVDGQIGYSAAGASRVLDLPSIGTAASATGNIKNSLGLKIGPGQFLTVAASAGLQTETLTVGIILIMSRQVEPVWDTVGSAGTPVLAPSTISAANTLQAVYL